MCWSLMLCEPCWMPLRPTRNCSSSTATRAGSTKKAACSSIKKKSHLTGSSGPTITTTFRSHPRSGAASCFKQSAAWIAICGRALRNARSLATYGRCSRACVSTRTRKQPACWTRASRSVAQYASGMARALATGGARSPQRDYESAGSSPRGATGERAASHSVARWHSRHRDPACVRRSSGGDADDSPASFLELRQSRRARVLRAVWLSDLDALTRRAEQIRADRARQILLAPNAAHFPAILRVSAGIGRAGSNRVDHAAIRRPAARRNLHRQLSNRPLLVDRTSV